MKSRIWTALVALLVIVSLAIPVLAAGGNRGAYNNSPCAVSNFADENNDGICDNRIQLDCDEDTGNKGENFVEQDNNGICNNKGTDTGKNFVDEDSDGLCDNKENGAGANFVDKNEDGVCDNRGTNKGKHCRNQKDRKSN